MSLAIAIMAHESREERVEKYLRPVLAGQAAAARSLGIVDISGPHVLMDDSPEGERGAGSWRNRCRCLALAGDHVLVVQDDVAVCADFVEAVYAIAEMQMDEIVCVAPKGRAAARMLAEGRAWERRHTSEWAQHVCGPCSLYPRWACDLVLAHGDAPHDDKGVSDALASATFLLAVPALATETTMESTIEGQVREVRAETWIGPQAMAPLETFLRQRFTV